MIEALTGERCLKGVCQVWRSGTRSLIWVVRYPEQSQTRVIWEAPHSMWYDVPGKVCMVVKLYVCYGLEAVTIEDSIYYLSACPPPRILGL